MVLSQAFIDGEDSNAKTLGEDLICATNSVLSNAPISNFKLKEVRMATLQDPIMNKLQEVILLG